MRLLPFLLPFYPPPLSLALIMCDPLRALRPDALRRVIILTQRPRHAICRLLDLARV
jgi:hypothetical protein